MTTEKDSDQVALAINCNDPQIQRAVNSFLETKKQFDQTPEPDPATIRKNKLKYTFYGAAAGIGIGVAAAIIGSAMAADITGEKVIDLLMDSKRYPLYSVMAVFAAMTMGILGNNMAQNHKKLATQRHMGIARHNVKTAIQEQLGNQLNDNTVEAVIANTVKNLNP